MWLFALLAVRIVTLDQALATARERQPQLRQAHAAAEAAGARADQAFAPLLPQVNATAGITRTWGETGSSLSLGGYPRTNYADQIGLSQLIWDFGAVPRRWQAAKAQAQAASSTELSQLLTVELNVRQTYFDARANKALVKVAEETVQNTQRHLDQIQGFVGAGTRPEIDLVQARTDLSNARVQQITAQNAWETSRVLLNAVMGVSADIDYDLGDEPPQPVPGEDGAGDAMLQEAEKARPEIAALEEQVHAQQLTVRAFEAQYLPALSGNLGFAQSGTKLDRLGWNASAGLTLSWQLFQGGLTRHEVREAEANLMGTVAQLDGQRQQLRVDVDGARLAVKAAKATTTASQEALANARERLRLAEQRYQVGVGSSIELGDAQVALTQAAAQLVQADDKLAVARAQLLHALGRR